MPGLKLGSLVILILLQLSAAVGFRLRKCLFADFSVACAEGFVILVGDAKIGVSDSPQTWHDCSEHATDCVEPTTRPAFSCDGQQVCPMQGLSLITVIKHCDNPANFVDIQYNCMTPEDYKAVVSRTTSTTPGPKPTIDPVSQPRTDDGTKMGLGVGLTFGIGIIVTAVVVTTLVLRKRKRSNAAKATGRKTEPNARHKAPSATNGLHRASPTVGPASLSADDLMEGGPMYNPIPEQTQEETADASNPYSYAYMDRESQKAHTPSYNNVAFNDTKDDIIESVYEDVSEPPVKNTQDQSLPSANYITVDSVKDKGSPHYVNISREPKPPLPNKLKTAVVGDAGSTEVLTRPNHRKPRH